MWPLSSLERCLGVFAAHAMFDLPLVQFLARSRAGMAQGFSEWVATFGLIVTILLTLRAKPKSIATSVGLYITAAYWFTASTSFANPAVTLARAFSDTFAGIRLTDVHCSSRRSCLVGYVRFGPRAS